MKEINVESISQILNADIRFDKQTDTFMYEIDQIWSWE